MSKEREILKEILLINKDSKLNTSYAEIIGRDDCFICGHPLKMSDRLEEIVKSILDKFELKRKKLPVKICVNPKGGFYYQSDVLDCLIRKNYFDTKQQAEAFCREYNLEIVED